MCVGEVWSVNARRRPLGVPVVRTPGPPFAPRQRRAHDPRGRLGILRWGRRGRRSSVVADRRRGAGITRPLDRPQRRFSERWLSGRRSGDERHPEGLKKGVRSPPDL